MDDTNASSLAQQCSNPKLTEFVQELKTTADLVSLYDRQLATVHCARYLDEDLVSKSKLFKTKSQIREVEALIRSQMQLLQPLSELNAYSSSTMEDDTMRTGDDADKHKTWTTLADKASAAMYCTAKPQSHEIRSILEKCDKAYDIVDGLALLMFQCDIADSITDGPCNEIIGSLALQTEGVLVMTASLSAAAIMMAVDWSNAIKSFARLLNTVMTPNGLSYDKSVPYVLQAMAWIFWLAKLDDERSRRLADIFSEIIQQLNQEDLVVLLNGITSIEDEMVRAKDLDLDPIKDDMATLPSKIKLLHQLCRSEAACIGIEFDTETHRFWINE